MSANVRFKVQDDTVMMILNGVLLAEWPWDKALEVSKALASVAKVAEGNSAPARDKIIQDQAVLMRSGFMPGLSLTPDARVFSEAKKEAQYNTKLRRYLRRTPCVPSGIKWGLPTIVNEQGVARASSRP